MSDIAPGDGPEGDSDGSEDARMVPVEPANHPAPASLSQATRALKVPPHSIEAEQSALGGLMLDNDAWFNVAEVISTSDFYRSQHQIIFDAMTALSADDQPLDAITLSERLQSKGQLDKAGGLAYLAELAESTPGASNVVAYAQIVRELSTLRQLIGAAQRIAESAFSRDGRPSDELLDMAEQEVFRISEGRMKGGGPEGVLPLLNRAVDRVEKLYANRNPITGLATGFDDLDKKTAGLQPADLVIVAGRPSMGKTALALNIAEHAAMVGEGAVLVFSMEMPSDQLVIRMLSSLGRIDQTRMRTGDMHEDDWPRFTSAVSQLKDKKLYIDDTPALTPTDLRTRARRVAREAGGLGLIVVDYLQLMRVAGTSENRTNEISEISRSLKAIAKEMRCPLVALSQLNRGLENRTDKRPVMADLRECVVGETLVNLADGRRLPIAELVGTEPEVLAMDESEKIVRARSDKVWSVGRREVLKVRVASGRELMATPRHRLYTRRGWLRLSDVSTEDQIAMARNLPVAAVEQPCFESRVSLRAASNGSTHSAFAPVKETVADYAQILDRETIQKWVDTDLFWDRVVSIEPAGEREVFDLTVPGPASWLADGIVSHNSGAIEQDADLILFIYRDEVYHPDTAEKGVAEIIIGKQRNGPIGRILLSFIGNLTKFENLAADRYKDFGPFE